MQKRALAFAERDDRGARVWTTVLAVGRFPALGEDWFRLSAIGMEMKRRYRQHRRVAFLLRRCDLVGQLRE